MICIIIYHFYQEIWKLKNVKNSFAAFILKKFVVHIRALKQTLNHGLILKKLHDVIQFNQEALLKLYIDMIQKQRMTLKKISLN